MVSYIACGLVVVVGRIGVDIGMKSMVDHKYASYHEFEGTHVKPRSHLVVPHLSRKRLDGCATRDCMCSIILN